MKSEEIYYLVNRKIDKSKWDECINSSFNGVIYAFSWYLDIVAENWNALVNKDYTIVFPLTYKKKLGIYYLCQPSFSQQLGIFSKNQLNTEIITLFLKNIPDKFKFIDINLNLGNNIEIPDFSITQRITYQLYLNNNYEFFRNRYSENTIRNIKKAEKNNIVVKCSNENQIQLVEFFINTTLKYDKNINNKTYLILKKLVSTIIKNKKGQLYSTSDINNDLCGCAFFINSNNKSIFLFSSANEFAKKNGAMHKLIDTFIKNNVKRDVILDFEGSMISSVARFYKSFGAEIFIYLKIKKNNFSKLIRWIK